MHGLPSVVVYRDRYYYHYTIKNERQQHIPSMWACKMYYGLCYEQRNASFVISPVALLPNPQHICIIYIHSHTLHNLHHSHSCILYLMVLSEYRKSLCQVTELSTFKNKYVAKHGNWSMPCIAAMCITYT